jgi:hypothetical protein
MNTAWVFAGVFTSLAGCADESRPASSYHACIEGPQPTLTVGHGDRSFMEIHDSDTQVELIHGPQGGFHSTIALRAQHVEPNSSYRLELRGTVGERALEYTVPWVGFDCVEDNSSLESTGSFLIWDAEPEALHGQVVSFTATLIDPHRLGTDGSVDGLRLVSDTAEYTIWDPRLE